MKHLFLTLFMLALTQPAVHAETVAQGEKTYAVVCGQCHGDATGYGSRRLALRVSPERVLLHTRTDLSPGFIRLAVRQGMLAMPPLSRVEISDPELEQVIQFLTRSNTQATP